MKERQLNECKATTEQQLILAYDSLITFSAVSLTNSDAGKEDK